MQKTSFLIHNSPFLMQQSWLLLTLPTIIWCQCRGTRARGRLQNSSFSVTNPSFLIQISSFLMQNSSFLYVKTHSAWHTAASLPTPGIYTHNLDPKSCWNLELNYVYISPGEGTLDKSHNVEKELSGSRIYLRAGNIYAEFRPKIIILKYMPRLINCII